MNFAIKMIVEAMLDCEELSRFKNTQVISRAEWDRDVPRDVRIRMIGQDYVRVGKSLVHITKTGSDVLGYREVAKT